MNRHTRGALALLACCSSWACAAADVRTRQARCGAEIVDALVAEREQAVRRALDGASAGATVELGSLFDAVVSLDYCSGIHAPPGNYFGYLPDDELRATFDEWVEWFPRHESCLRLDTETLDLERSAAPRDPTSGLPPYASRQRPRRPSSPRFALPPCLASAP